MQNWTSCGRRARVSVSELLVFALLFAATGIGWVLGRRSANLPVPEPDLPSQYYRGLNYLLDGRQDGAVDTFINALEVNSETLETHIALGNLLRKKGEVERAIRVHQNLLARPSLPQNQVHRAHLELARDYISAGLLDRAERLLLDLLEESPAQAQSSRRFLLEIYQSEREWERAIAVATELLPRKSRPGDDGEGWRGQPVAVALSHYYCELAAEKVTAGELPAARALLQKTLTHDRGCVRASLMLGEVEHASGRYRQAVKVLQNVKSQDSDFIPETIATLRACYTELGSDRSLLVWLQECVRAAPSAALVLAVADELQRLDGVAAASEFLSAELARRPSLRGLAQLISLQMGETEGKVREDLALLQVLVKRLVAERPGYRCSHCGFSGHQLHWSCPGCQYWGTISSLRGALLD